jgi:hypothetical protein
LRVDLAARARLFLDRPIAGAHPFRSLSVYELRAGGPLRVRIPKRAGSRSLGVVLYFDGHPPEDATLEAVVDRGQRQARPGTLSLERTSLRRTLPITVAPLEGALHLNRGDAGGTWVSAPVYVPLHDDLQPGVHQVSLAVRGARVRSFARFFAYGARTRERLAHFNQLREETTQ